jgi:hypothetical protein
VKFSHNFCDETSRFTEVNKKDAEKMISDEILERTDLIFDHKLGDIRSHINSYQISPFCRNAMLELIPNYDAVLKNVLDTYIKTLRYRQTKILQKMSIMNSAKKTLSFSDSEEGEGEGKEADGRQTKRSKKRSKKTSKKRSKKTSKKRSTKRSKKRSKRSKKTFLH